jgi:hypothetical protein
MIIFRRLAEAAFATVLLTASVQAQTPPPPALGVPPDGTYTCGKISGSMYMVLGELSLSQGRYEGFGSTGDLGIYPDDTLSFMDGMELFPAITDVRYFSSTTEDGILRISYTSESGWAEVLDCQIE